MDADAISDQHFLVVKLYKRGITALTLLHCEAHRVVAATSLSAELEETIAKQFIGKRIVSPNSRKLVEHCVCSCIRQEHNRSDLKLSKPEL